LAYQVVGIQEPDVSVGALLVSYLCAGFVDMESALAVPAVAIVAAGALLARIFVVYKSWDGELTAVRQQSNPGQQVSNFMALSMLVNFSNVGGLARR